MTAPTDPDAAPPGPPLNRMVIAVLSTAGFFVALYLLAHHLGWTGPLVCGVGDCATVQSSPYARMAGIPVAAFGAAGYLALFGLSFAGLGPTRRDSRVIGGLLFAGALAGVAYSGYLTYLEAAVIHAWCQWCVISAVLITVIFLATIPEVRRLAR